MALDGVFLYSIIDELKTNLINGKIDKVNQPEKDEITLNIRKGRSSFKLLISSSSNYPRLHLTNFNKTNPMKAPMFCMVLRKYINNAKILDIYQINNDRIAIIDFESTDELGFNSIYSLIIEIMGRHSNITLIRKRDNVIMDSIKHITPDINTYRCIYPGIQYVYPPESLKLNPFNFTFDEFNNYFVNNNLEFTDNVFSKVFTGVSKTLSSELCYKLHKDNIELNLSSLKNISNLLNDTFKDIQCKNFSFNSYSKNNTLLDFYCIDLTCNYAFTKIKYNSPSELLENFYYAKDKADRLKAKSSDLQKIVLNNINRCLKKEKILNKTLEKCLNKDSSKLYGELLTANIYSLKKGMKEIEVLNYYSENCDMIKITLDENKTPSQNVQIYYKKYNKLKKSEEAAHVQLQQNSEELDYIYSVLTNINNADNYDEIEEIKKELVETGYIKFKKIYKTKNSKTSKPMHYVSKDGFDIYIGKNNMQNDYLTLKFAHKHDIWFHTKNIPGSHVIIKNTGNIPDSTLLEAANLAAYYSKSQNSSNVPVDYTEVKNVKKPNGAKPGMVIYSTNQTIYVTPTNPLLNE